MKVPQMFSGHYSAHSYVPAPDWWAIYDAAPTDGGTAPVDVLPVVAFMVSDYTGEGVPLVADTSGVVGLPDESRLLAIKRGLPYAAPNTIPSAEIHAWRAVRQLTRGVDGA